MVMESWADPTRFRGGRLGPESYRDSDMDKNYEWKAFAREVSASKIELKFTMSLQIVE